jgi:hypothetical protein
MVIRLQKKNVKHFFLVAFLVSLIFLAGCNSRSSTIPESQGISSADGEIIVSRVGIETAINFLNADDGLRLGRGPDYTIHNIVGRDLDTSGQATTWVLSVNTDEPFYLVYRSDLIRTIRWTEAEKDNAIDQARIILPDELFRKNKDLIMDVTNRGIDSIDELELRNGIYYLRGIQPGEMWEHTFYATTGNQIS